MEGRVFRPLGLPTDAFRHHLLALNPFRLVTFGIGSMVVLYSTLAQVTSFKTLSQTILDVACAAAYPAAMLLPMALKLGSTASLTCHVLASVVLWCTGMGLVTSATGAWRPILTWHLELLLEAGPALQSQMGLPALAVLQALRQIAWMTMLVSCTDTDPSQGLLRGVCNWMLLITASVVIDGGSPSAYLQRPSAQQMQPGQEQQEHQQVAEQQQHQQAAGQQHQHQQHAVQRQGVQLQHSLPDIILPPWKDASEATSPWDHMSSVQRDSASDAAGILRTQLTQKWFPAGSWDRSCEDSGSEGLASPTTPPGVEEHASASAAGSFCTTTVKWSISQSSIGPVTDANQHSLKEQLLVVETVQGVTSTTVAQNASMPLRSAIPSVQCSPPAGPLAQLFLPALAASQAQEHCSLPAVRITTQDQWLPAALAASCPSATDMVQTPTLGRRRSLVGLAPEEGGPNSCSLEWGCEDAVLDRKAFGSIVHPLDTHGTLPSMPGSPASNSAHTEQWSKTVYASFCSMVAQPPDAKDDLAISSHADTQQPSSDSRLANKALLSAHSQEVMGWLATAGVDGDGMQTGGVEQDEPFCDADDPSALNPMLRQLDDSAEQADSNQCHAAADGDDRLVKTLMPDVSQRLADTDLGQQTMRSFMSLSRFRAGVGPGSSPLPSAGAMWGNVSMSRHVRSMLVYPSADATSKQPTDLVSTAAVAAAGRAASGCEPDASAYPAPGSHEDAVPGDEPGAVTASVSAAVSVAGSTAGTPDARAVVTAPRAFRTVAVSVAGSARAVVRQQHSARTLLDIIDQQRSQPYRSNRKSTPSTMQVKVKGLELEHLPPDLPRLLHDQLRVCMPGVSMAGLALRSGCVMLMLDLLQAGVVAGADGMAEAITRLMQSQAMGQLLEDGASMHIQTAAGLMLCQWNRATSSYKLVDTTGHTNALDLPGLSLCRLLSNQPAVYCLPDSASPSGDATSHQLTVELELPSNCQLHGWQPVGAAVPETKDESRDDAMLLARRLDGGYLPVVVERVVRVVKGGAGSEVHHAVAQVLVALDGALPAALSLELWYKPSAAQADGGAPLAAAGESSRPPAAGTTDDQDHTRSVLASDLFRSGMPASGTSPSIVDPDILASSGSISGLLPPVLARRVLQLKAGSGSTPVSHDSAISMPGAVSAHGPHPPTARTPSMAEPLGHDARLPLCAAPYLFESSHEPASVRRPNDSAASLPTQPAAGGKQWSLDLLANAPATAAAALNAKYDGLTGPTRAAAAAIEAQVEGEAATSSTASTADRVAGAADVTPAPAGGSIARAAGHELLVAHMPLLVLPSSWKEAAAELQQHMERMCGMQPQHAFPHHAVTGGHTPPSVTPLASSREGGAALTAADACLASARRLSESELSIGDAFEAAGDGTGDIVSGLAAPVMARSRARSSLCLDTAQELYGDVPPSPGPPSPTSAGRDGMACLIEDLGTWLTHQQRSLEAPLPPAMPHAEVSQLGVELLVYAVQHGMASLASRMVDVLEQGRAGAEGAFPRKWLHQAAHGGDEGGIALQGRTPLLHAAMTSGEPSILDTLLRWGTLYGGPDWAWPWELEDATGCTALHLAAAQPAHACLAMLETLTSLLPAAQVQAIRSVWLRCQGGVSVNLTPAELFELASDGANADRVWDSVAAAARPTRPSMDHSMRAMSSDAIGAPVGGAVRVSSSDYLRGISTDTLSIVDSQTDATAVLGSGRGAEAALLDTSSTASGQQAHAVCGSSSSAGCSAQPAPVVTVQAGGQPLSWLETLVEVWTTPETVEYNTWAKQQMSTLVCSWAVTLVSMGVLSILRSARAGCLADEAIVTVLHTICYIPMALATCGIACLGDWKAWMLVLHAFHSMAYITISLKTAAQIASWAAAVSNYADVVYVIILTAPLDQTPLPKLLLAKIVEATFHSRAYRNAGQAHPQVRALIVHGAALALTTVCRMRQLRAYRRWQTAQRNRLGAKHQHAGVFGGCSVQ